MDCTSRTILLRRAVDRDGVTLFEFAKQVLGDGVVIKSEPHLLSVPPVMANGSSPKWDYIKSQVDANLAGLGFPATTDEDWGLVTGFSDAVVTPDVVQAFMVAQDAEKERLSVATVQDMAAGV